MAEDRFNFQWSSEEGFSLPDPEELLAEERAEDARVAAEEPAVRRTEEEPFDGDLKQSDLLESERLNDIRAYMTDLRGIQYRDMEPEDVVDDFVQHMRNFNTNTISTAGVVRYISTASDEQKVRAARAYEHYDSLGSVFANDGFYGAVEGVGEYIRAAALDPTNYLGLLTGGLGKVGAAGITRGGRELVKQAVREATERAAASGATRSAAEAAGKAAGERTIQRLASRGIQGEAADNITSRVAQLERERIIGRAGAVAGRAVMEPLEQRASQIALYGTFALDGTLAAMNDYQIQNVMMDVGLQEEYSRTQTALSSLFGVVGAGAQLLGRQAQGASGLGDGKIRLEEARIRGEQESLVRTALDADEIDQTVDLIEGAISSWQEKVARGTAMADTTNAPVELLYEVMMGSNGRGGLAQLMRDKGIRITRNRTVSDVMTNIISQLPQDKLKQINDKLEPMTGLTLGDTAFMGQRLADLFAKDINVAGRTLNVMAQSKKTINSGVVHGNNLMDAIARRDEVVEKINVEMGLLQKAGNLGQYTQSVWRRLLVSSPATSMVNVAGYAQFSVGQTVADLFNAGSLGLYGLAQGGNLTAKGRETLRMARVYSTIQAQKMRNFADPFTTHDTYMALIESNPELEKRLFESFAGGVERVTKRFNIDPNSTGVKLTESITNGANIITGVRIQDTFTKSQMFLTEIDKALRLNKNTTLDDAMTTGVLDDIFDDDIINPALDSTLKSVFSKNYTTDDQVPLLKEVAKITEMVSNTPVLGTVLPFGRFLNNVVATAYQWGPISFFPTMVGVMKSSASAGEKIMAREAFARSVVGTAALYSAWEADEARRAKGLGAFEIEAGDGTIIDAKNTYPYSLFLGFGRILNLRSRGEPIPGDLTREALAQLAVGQAATDLQFGNDLFAAADAVFNIGSDDANYADMTKGLLRGLGNWAAGFTRPLDAVNKLVGYMDNSDAARDLRQAEGVELLTQSSTRYLDNIFEALFDRVDNVTGEELRLATREGPIMDPNPMARVFGLTVKPSRTATEQVYSMANLAEFTAGERSNLPEYDRLFQMNIAPRLEEEFDRLRRDSRYIEGDTRARKIMLTERLGRVRRDVREFLSAGGGGTESEILSLRRRASRHGNAEQRSLALGAMRERFNFDGSIRDMGVKELQYFMDYVDYIEATLE